MPYKCIICSEDMSYKGVCKRHLDEQHVAPSVYRCERCGLCFDTKVEAKRHCNRCGMGVFHFIVTKPPPKAIYTSEYTGEWFPSKSMYLEHLLKLSKKGSLRPQPSLHRKLRALLGHASLREHAIDMSEVTHGYTDAWRRLRWSDEQLQRAIRQLEEAAVVHDNGSITFEGTLAQTQQALNVRHFLHSLFSAGTLTDCTSNQDSLQTGHEETRAEKKDRRSSVSTAIRRGSTAGMMSPPNVPQIPKKLNKTQSSNIANSSTHNTAMHEVMPLAQEVRTKRHLSDWSDSAARSRRPPGPPILPLSLSYMPSGQLHTTMESNFQTQAHMTLPDRSVQEHAAMSHHGPQIASHPPSYDTMNAVDLSHIRMDSASTLVSMYQDPESYYPIQIPYEYWPSEQNMNFHFDFKNEDGRITEMPCNYPSDTSTRTSVATEQSFFDSGEDEPKAANYTAFHQYTPTGLGTFLIDDDEQQQQQQQQQHEMANLNNRFAGF